MTTTRFRVVCLAVLVAVLLAGLGVRGAAAAPLAGAGYPPVVEVAPMVAPLDPPDPTVMAQVKSAIDDSGWDLPSAISWSQVLMGSVLGGFVVFFIGLAIFLRLRSVAKRAAR